MMNGVRGAKLRLRVECWRGRTRDEGRRLLRYAASDVEEGRMELDKHSGGRVLSKLCSHKSIRESKAKSREEEES